MRQSGAIHMEASDGLLGGLNRYKKTVQEKLEDG